MAHTTQIGAPLVISGATASCAVPAKTVTDITTAPPVLRTSGNQ